MDALAGYGSDDDVSDEEPSQPFQSSAPAAPAAAPATSAVRATPVKHATSVSQNQSEDNFSPASQQQQPRQGLGLALPPHRPSADFSDLFRRRDSRVPQPGRPPLPPGPLGKRKWKTAYLRHLPPPPARPFPP
ncbi:hypothetical protein CLOP_g8790 [Closterium sp. NIES-67]|nr:hypothetical protein CLOP_g8790 [Closterium sp. NIES-67]